MGMNFTHRHCWLPATHWDAWFLNSTKCKTRMKFMKLGMLSWNGINMLWYKFCPIWGQAWVYASHKPELLTTSMMVFGRGRSRLWGRNNIHCLLLLSIFSSSQHRTTGVLCDFCDFLGFIWTFLCINWVFNAFMCIIQIWTTCKCSSAYKLVKKSNLCPWVLA